MHEIPHTPKEKSLAKSVACAHFDKDWHLWEEFLFENLLPIFDKCFPKYEQKTLINEAMEQDPTSIQDFTRCLSEFVEDLNPKMRDKYEKSLEKGPCGAMTAEAMYHEMQKPNGKWGKRNSKKYRPFSEKVTIDEIESKYVGGY